MSPDAREALLATLRLRCCISATEAVSIVGSICSQLHLPPGVWAEAAGPSTCHLSGGRRNVVVLRVRISIAKTASPYDLSVVVKRPHHFSEPERSLQASALDLGPHVYHASEAWIVEDFLPDASNWRAAAPIFARQPGPLGKQLLQKYLLMLQGVRHRFDDLPTHTFVLGHLERPDVRWIDWGRTTTKLDTTRVDYVVTSHFASLTALLLPIVEGPQVWSAMVSALGTIGTGSERAFASKLLESVRKYYLSKRVGRSAKIRRPRWEKFFEVAETFGTKELQG